MPTSSAPLLAFYGGSFNPVHYGHIKTAQYLAQLLPESKIIFLPNSSPPHKDTAKLSYEARRAMLKAAIAECLPECDAHGQSRYSICDLEADASQRHYTVDTLQQLNQLYPNNELAFIMGWDSLATLDQWKQGLELHHLAKLIVAVQQSLAQYPEHYLIVPNPEFDLSSSAIRQQIAQTKVGTPLPELTAALPRSVHTLIATHGYYRSA